MKDSARQAGKLRLVQAKLELARRFRDLTLEQQKLIRKLPSEKALARIYTLVDERQQCIDKYNLLSQAEAEMGASSSCYLDDERGLDKVLADLQATLAEAAAVDEENVAAMEQEKIALMKQIGQIRSGRRVLDAYGRQPGAPAAFIDKSK